LTITLINFRNDPASRNPYSIAGTTDAGEKFSWGGYFYLDPLRSQGDVALENLQLTKYPLYQDFVRFRIKEGNLSIQSTYHFELNPSNQVAWVTNMSMSLRSLRVTESDDGPDLVSLPEFSVSGISADAEKRQAEVASVTGAGARLYVRRDKDKGINVLEASKPDEPVARAPEAVLLLLRGITNAVSTFLNSTNAWRGAVDEVHFKDCGVKLEDLANARPVRLDLDGIALSATNISNLPGTNLTASLSLRWNTNGAIKTEVQASFSPLAADVHVGLSQLELKALDPYLESKLDVFIVGSKLSMDAQARLRAKEAQLPQVTFAGDMRLDDFSSVDGVLSEDLLKWSSVRLSGIQANLNPQEVTIKEIAIDDAYVRAVIETNHTVNLLAALRMSNTNAAETTGPAEAKPEKSPAKKSGKKEVQPTEAPSPPEPAPSSLAALPKVSINAVVISNAQFGFTDRSVMPSVNVSIQEFGGTITGLSSEQLGHADLDLHAKVDNVGPVEVTGKLNLLALQRGSAVQAGSQASGSGSDTNQIKITVKNVDLTPTSPYVGRFAGYSLLEGKLGMDLDYQIYNRKIQSRNLIVLDRFTFGEKVNSPDATKLPVRLAIAILKDRDGRIKLDVPVEGSLDDPQFRVHKVIVRALENILTKVATSPFSLLGAVFGGRGGELSYQEFAAGSATLQHPDKLDTLAKGLFERPGLQLEIAGSVDLEKDSDGLRQAAVERRLRTAKWMSLSKSDRETTQADQVIIAPEERLRWLKEVYAAAKSKGEITESAVSAAAAPGSESPAQVLAQLGPAETERGATVLMEKVSLKTGARKSAGPVSKPAKGDVAGTLQQVLENSIPISDNDFRTLAEQRAKAARDYLIQNGKVQAERIFLAETQDGTVKAQGSKAFLQFR